MTTLSQQMRATEREQYERDARRLGDIPRCAGDYLASIFQVSEEYDLTNVIERMRWSPEKSLFDCRPKKRVAGGDDFVVNWVRTSPNPKAGLMFEHDCTDRIDVRGPKAREESAVVHNWRGGVTVTNKYALPSVVEEPNKDHSAAIINIRATELVKFIALDRDCGKGPSGTRKDALPTGNEAS